MKEFKRNFPIKIIIKFAALLFLTFNLTSCFYGSGDDDDPIVAGRNNTYKGIVVDTNGNPIVGKTVVLSSGFDQYIAEFVTDENGLFEGQGDIYDTGLQVEIRSDVDSPDVNINFVRYQLRYTEYPSEQIIEISPLIYAPISFFSIDIINNTGENYIAEYQFVTGSCNKSFENNIETYSLCYEETNRNFNLVAATGPFRRSVFALIGSTILVTLTNNVNTITETFVIDEINQVESMVFE